MELTLSYSISATFNCWLGRSKKRPIPHPQEIFAVRGGGEGNCLKNVLNLYRMSKEGEGVLLISSVGVWIFSGMTNYVVVSTGILHWLYVKIANTIHCWQKLSQAIVMDWLLPGLILPSLSSSTVSYIIHYTLSWTMDYWQVGY